MLSRIPVFEISKGVPPDDVNYFSSNMFTGQILDNILYTLIRKKFVLDLRLINY